jgi:hypothetical protein
MAGGNKSFHVFRPCIDGCIAARVKNQPSGVEEAYQIAHIVIDVFRSASGGGTRPMPFV